MKEKCLKGLINKKHPPFVAFLLSSIPGPGCYSYYSYCHYSYPSWCYSSHGLRTRNWTGTKYHLSEWSDDTGCQRACQTHAHLMLAHIHAYAQLASNFIQPSNAASTLDPLSAYKHTGVLAKGEGVGGKLIHPMNDCECEHVGTDCAFFSLRIPFILYLTPVTIMQS